MAFNQDPHQLLHEKRETSRCFSFVLCLALFAVVICPVFAQGASQRIQIKYTNDLLTISVKNTDIKDFFQELAKKTDIHIEYPSDMEKNITLNKKGVSLKEFFSSFLRNMNYALVLSGPDSGKKKITEVYIYPDAKGSTLSHNARTRITNRIAAYRKNIEKTKEKLKDVAADSRRAKAYQKRITRYEKRIEDLESQL